MIARPRRLAVALSLAAACAACQNPPAKSAGPATPAATDEPPPPPPKPKCDALDEGCVAKEGDREAIAETGWSIALPPGWTFARGSGLVARSDASVMAIEAKPVADPKKPPVDDALAEVLGKLSVAFPKRTGKLTVPKKPQKTVAVGKVNVALHQFDGAVRESKKGPVLVFTAALPDGPIVVGAGFVPDDDKSNADAAILKAIESLAPAASAETTSAAP